MQWIRLHNVTYVCVYVCVYICVCMHVFIERSHIPSWAKEVTLLPAPLVWHVFGFLQLFPFKHRIQNMQRTLTVCSLFLKFFAAVRKWTISEGLNKTQVQVSCAKIARGVSRTREEWGKKSNGWNVSKMSFTSLQAGYILKLVWKFIASWVPCQDRCL